MSVLPPLMLTSAAIGAVGLPMLWLTDVPWLGTALAINGYFFGACWFVGMYLERPSRQRRQ